MERSMFSYWCWVNIPDGEGYGTGAYVEVQYRDLLEAEGKIREVITSKHGPNFTDLEIHKVEQGHEP